LGKRDVSTAAAADDGEHEVTIIPLAPAAPAALLLDDRTGCLGGRC
jgi:hypothetical protein